MTLDELYKYAQDAAKFLFDKQGTIQPMWLCETENGQLMPICIEMPARDARDSIATVLKDLFKYHKVVRYASILEAWAIKSKTKSKKEAIDEFASVSTLANHPDRIEVIHIIAEEKSGPWKSGTFQILRPEKGKPALSPFEDFDAAKHEGRFSNLLT